MKEPSVLIGKLNLIKREMREIVIKTAEPDSTREATDILVKTLDINYAKSDLNQVANDSTQMNAEK